MLTSFEALVDRAVTGDSLCDKTNQILYEVFTESLCVCLSNLLSAATEIAVATLLVWDTSAMILENDVRAGEPGSGEPTFDSNVDRLKVIVVFTTLEGTLAALNSAATLARSLCADIKLVVAEEVYFRYPLQGSPVSAEFLDRLCRALIGDSSLDVDEVKIEIHFCRDQLKYLELYLRQRSLIVIGAKQRGWAGRQRRMQRTLVQQGHEAVLVRGSSSVLASRCHCVIHRLVDEMRSEQRNSS